MRVVAAGIAFGFIFQSSLSLAQTTPPPTRKRPAIEASRSIRISYGSVAWNTDSKLTDSAFLFLRDGQSNRVVKINLEETEPDSSTFSGQFAISWATPSAIEAEIYIPPKEMRGSEQDVVKFNSLLNQGKITRKPIVSKKDDKGNMVIEVYDTRDQAQRALDIYKEELKARQAKKSLTKPAASESTLEAARNAQRLAAIEKLALDAQKRASDRIRMEQIERQKAEELRRQQEALSQAERKARMAEAKRLAEEGLALYSKGEFSSAEALFAKSMELDPSNDSYYYKYGVCLYRAEKFNEALVIMKMVKPTPQIEQEKKYYEGLIHFRLKEIDQSLGKFREVKASGDKMMGPTAAFYEGVVLMSLEKYEEAKDSFEYVIDRSEDPKLDEQAEAYIEKITQIVAYKKSQNRKWLATASLGLMYDSNVTYSPDNASDQGSATDQEAFRLLFSAEGDYRMLNTEKHELSGKLGSTVLLSLDESWVELDKDLGRADPYLVNVGLPYTYKSTAWKKGYKLTVKPGYELLYMNVSDDVDGTSPEKIMSSFTLNADNTFIMTDAWFASYIVDIRSDDSSLTSSTGDEDLDSTKLTLKTNQMVFMDKAKKEAVIPSAALVLNQAAGKNKVFQRLDLGINYMRPTNWDSTLISGLTFYLLQYPDASNERDDKNVALNLGFAKPINEWFTWTVMGNYTINSSNLDSYQYSKYSLMSIASFRLEK